MSASSDVGYHAQRQARWHYGEAAFWLVVLACGFLFPTRYLIMTDILRLALFAMSLDLILGYAGIVSLGHAASSASAPTPRDCWRCTASSTSRCWR
jgi:branched-chain amino acid transport system permease protein